MLYDAIDICSRIRDESMKRFRMLLNERFKPFP